MNRLIPFFILLLLSGCTIEKRLYTGGWSVSPARGWKNAAEPEEPRVLAAKKSVVTVRETTSFTDAAAPGDDSQMSFPVSCEATTVSRQATTAIKADETPDTLYVADDERPKMPKKELTRERKRNAMFIMGAGIAFAGFGMVALVLNAATATAPIFFFTLFLFYLLAILALIFVVSLFVIASRTVTAGGELPEDEEDPGDPVADEVRSKGKKRGLIAALVLVLAVVGIIIAGA